VIILAPGITSNSSGKPSVTLALVITSRQENQATSTGKDSRRVHSSFGSTVEPFHLSVGT